MTRHLPPLNSLRAFEAAARHQSFTKAADELFVTAGAVSRQVQVLEEYLGTALFTRLNREVVITAEGEQYRNSLTKAFDQINMSTQFLKTEKKLTIGGYLTFGMKWLVPRLPAFMTQFPKYPVSLSTTNPNLADVASGTLDVAFMGGTEAHHWPGVVAHKLFPFTFEPVFSPSLLKQSQVKEPSDLRNIMLLHSAQRPDDWRYWLEESGTDSVSPDSGTVFETSSLSFQAALSGMGAAIGQHAMLTEEIKSGALVCPFARPHHDGSWYYLAYAKKFAEHRPVIQFRNWVFKEVRRFNEENNNWNGLVNGTELDFEPVGAAT